MGLAPVILLLAFACLWKGIVTENTTAWTDTSAWTNTPTWNSSSQTASCADSCGTNAEVCWCDQVCVSAGDCCDDACSVCGFCDYGSITVFSPQQGFYRAGESINVSWSYIDNIVNVLLWDSSGSVVQTLAGVFVYAMRSEQTFWLNSSLLGGYYAVAVESDFNSSKNMVSDDFYIYPEDYCTDHEYCTDTFGDNMFCNVDVCAVCDECEVCSDGVDYTCGNCDSSIECVPDCSSHEDCETTGFCNSYGFCEDCSYCLGCSYGMNDTCGYCGNTICSVGCGYPGVYCSSGSFIDCGPGSYCPSFNMSAPLGCSEGYYCPGETQTEQILCEIGYWCTSTTQNACSAENGDICDATGLSEPGTCFTDDITDLEMCYSPYSVSCTVDLVNTVCVCEGIYSADSMCTEEISLVSSFVVAGLAFVLVIVVGCPCLCCDGVLLVSAKVDKQLLHRNLRKTKTKLEELYRKKQKKRQKRSEVKKSKLEDKKNMEHLDGAGKVAPEATLPEASDYDKAKGPNRLNGGATAKEWANQSSWKNASRCVSKDNIKEALGRTMRWLQFLICYAGIFFISYASDIGKMVANAFLIIKSIYSFVGWDLSQHIEQFVDALRGFLNENLSWVADMYAVILTVFENLNFRLLVINGMEVTCDGCQAPTKLLMNLVVVICIVFLYEAHFFPLVRVTFKRFTDLYSSSAETKLQLMFGVVLKNVYLALESSFKYFIQLGIATSTYTSFFYSTDDNGDYTNYSGYHQYNQYCTAFDQVLAIMSTVLLILFVPAIAHVGLRCYIWGFPKGVRFNDEDSYDFFSKRLGALCCHTRALHFKPDDFYAAEKRKSFRTKDMLKEQADDHREHFSNYDDDFPCLIDMLVIIFLGKDEGDRSSILKKYLKVMAWKFVQLLKLTLGIWDESLLRSFHIVEMGSRLCIKEDEAPAQEVISMYGQAHSIIWQIFPMFTVVAKFGEYSNIVPLFVAEEVKVEGRSEPHKIELAYKDFNPDLKDPNENGTMNWKQKIHYFASYLQGRRAKWLVSIITWALTVALAFSPVKELMIAFCYFVLPFKLWDILGTMDDMGFLPEELEFLVPFTSPGQLNEDVELQPQFKMDPEYYGKIDEDDGHVGLRKKDNSTISEDLSEVVHVSEDSDNEVYPMSCCCLVVSN